MSSELSSIAEGAVALAKKRGATDAAATATSSRDVETTWRDGKIEKVSDAVSRSLGLQLYVDGKYGSMSTSDLRPDALERFVAEAVAMTRAIAPDAHRKLPDPSLYAGRSEEDLETYDPRIVALTADARVDYARAVEAAARGASGASAINSVTAGVGDGFSESARATTNGFSGGYRNTYVSSWALVSVKDEDGRRPQDWDDASVRMRADLPAPDVVGKRASERALARLGAKKMASGTMNLFVEARAAGTLLRHLLSPLQGGSLQQRESFLEGKLGALVTSPLLTLTDDPLLRRGLASRPYDREGIASRRRPIFEKGRLKTYLLDVYYASKLKMAPTTGGTTNVVLTPGTRSREALLGAMKDGVYVTSFLGGNSNSTTGVFSLGISGFRVRGGKLAEPVAEMNVSGNHLDFWKRLVAVGDDPNVFSSLRTPSLVFEKVSVAGT